MMCTGKLQGANWVEEVQASISPSRDAHDLKDGSSRPKYKNSITAITIGHDALKQMMVSTGTYCSTHNTFSTKLAAG